jgi:hypothetical protein
MYNKGLFGYNAPNQASGWFLLPLSPLHSIASSNLKHRETQRTADSET